MKKLLITVVNILVFRLFVIGCTTPLFLALFYSKSFPIGAYSYYNNIARFEIIEVVADSHYIKVEEIESFKGNLEVGYIGTKWTFHYEKGDTITIYYRDRHVFTTKDLKGEVLEILPCSQKIIYEKNLSFSSPSLFDYTKQYFNKELELLRTFRDTKAGSIDMILDDGTRLVGQLKNDQPVGIWKLFYPEKRYKNLMCYRVDFDKGFGQFYHLNYDNGAVESDIFGFTPTNFDKNKKPKSVEEHYGRSD